MLLCICFHISWKCFSGYGIKTVIKRVAQSKALTNKRILIIFVEQHKCEVTYHWKGKKVSQTKPQSILVTA
jgi:hypothetical protein